MSKRLPQVLQKRGLYYGYVILVVGTLGLIASLPGQTMGISVYTNYLVRDLGIDRLTLSLLYLFGTLTSAFLLPLAGRVVDRFGARFLAILASVGLILCLVFLAKSASVIAWLSVWLPFGTVISTYIVVYLCFFGVRHFGQGQLTIASRTMMGRWFEKRRGLVFGVSGVFVAFAFGVAPYLLNALIEMSGWVNSLIVISCGLAGFAVLVFFFFKESPEACGLVMDGGLVPVSSVEQNHKSTVVDADVSLTVAEAKKTYSFWVYNLGVSAQALIVTGVTFNIADIGAQHGLESSETFEIFIYISIIAIFAQLASGYLSDRIPMRYILIAMQGSLALSLYGLYDFGSVIGYWMAAIGLGVSGGIFSLLVAAAWPKLFGLKYLGAIYGVVSSWMVGGSALGPYLLSQGKALTGDYSFVLLLSSLIPLIVFFMAFFATPPCVKPLESIAHDTL